MTPAERTAPPQPHDFVGTTCRKCNQTRASRHDHLSTWCPGPQPDSLRGIGVEQRAQDAGQSVCGTEGRAPDEPLDYIGTEPPPVGYVRLGSACPRDAALRCSGCDETDVTPDMCGSGHPAYRSQKWIAWAGRPLPFPSALASTGEQPDGGTYPAIEIDQNYDHVLSAIIEKGGVCMDIGEDWSGRRHGPHRPQGFQRYTCINLSLDEATRLCDWLSGAISRIKAVPPTDAGLSSTETEEERQAHG